MLRASPLRKPAGPSLQALPTAVGSEGVLCVAVQKAAAPSVGASEAHRLGTGAAPTPSLQLHTQLCTAVGKRAVHAAPLGEIWSAKQEEHQLEWREAELMRAGC